MFCSKPEGPCVQWDTVMPGSACCLLCKMKMTPTFLLKNKAAISVKRTADFVSKKLPKLYFHRRGFYEYN